MDNLKTEPRIAQEPHASDWLTPKDLQHALRIGEKLAYKLLKSGSIPSVRVGGLIRIYRPQLEEALLEDLDLGEEKGRAHQPGRIEKPPAKGVFLDDTR
jgi:excisionase family DNA binding protein